MSFTSVFLDKYIAKLQEIRISLNCALYAKGDIGILINKKCISLGKINKEKNVIDSAFYFHYQKRAQNIMEKKCLFLIFEAPFTTKELIQYLLTFI